MVANKMVVIKQKDIKGVERSFYIDGYLKSNMDMAKAKIKEDWDWTFLIDGRERSGKSVLAMQLAFYCDPTFNLKRVAISSDEFQHLILNAEPYTSIVYDEAYTGLASMDTQSRVTKTLIKMMAEIGQKNLFVFIVMPTFFKLTDYIAIWRSSALIHIYTGEDRERGFFMFFNDERKKNLYLLGKKLYDYGATKSNFIGRFLDDYVVDKAAYKKKKKDALKHNYEKENESQFVAFQEFLFQHLKQFSEEDVPIKIRKKILLMSEGTYYNRLHADKEREKNKAIFDKPDDDSDSQG